MRTRESPPPPPGHVHVAGNTPVHVHVRSSKPPQLVTLVRSTGNTGRQFYCTCKNRTKDYQKKGDGARHKVRSPWIPPGGPSSRKDLGLHSCQRSRAQLQSGHRCGGEEQEENTTPVPRTLSVLLREEEDVRHLKRQDSRSSHGETDELLRALVEAEIDGVTVANQLTALKETVDSLVKDKRLSKLNAASVGRQQELLLEKLQMFDYTNQSLRELLREWTQNQRDSLAWSEQKDALKKRMADSEAENIRLLAQLSNTEKEASRLALHLDLEKDNLKTTEEQWRILESTRNNMESQMNTAEAGTARMSAQIQGPHWEPFSWSTPAPLPCAGQRMQENQEPKQEVLQTQRQRREEDHEETQWRRDQKAPVTQQAPREMEGRLQEKETQLVQALATSSDWCLRHSKEAAAKKQLEEEVSVLKLHVNELDYRLHSAEDRTRQEREKSQEQLHHLMDENASTKLENQRLQAEFTTFEEKLRGFQTEAHQLKTSIKKYEDLVEKYKKKVQQARLESEEYCLKLEMMQKEMQEVKVSLEREKEQVRRELLGRLRELEALPDRLSRTEQQLRDAQQEVDAHERRTMENSSALSEVRHQVKQQHAQLEMFQQENLRLQEKNDILKETIHRIERSLEDTREEHKEMSEALTSKEAGVQRVQQQLEEKMQECSSLTRQLQQALDAAERQVDNNMQKVLAKERVSQSKTLDLVDQLSHAKTELSQHQRSKEQMERQFQSQLQSMKDRLEQSDSTNCSLQNYVQFLKTSYRNVFGDGLLTD
ncbi:outer dense fiber protein 2 [Pleuronectes platessa]|uniref:outer dense fiber protein 2 n=1 Tax=Pleuronectes platessa TaxID=8262 RepID=UPI00232A21EF|nr:outer dense fiber protein 2 [Pleuronectes platessa]